VVEELWLSIRNADRALADHSGRTAILAGALGRAVDFSPVQVIQVQIAARLHDIGKVEIERRLLDKPTKLSPLEMVEVARHPLIGFQMLKDLVDEEIAQAVLCHHERFDGRGYPVGLIKTEIPLTARVLSVADAFDAMTSHRTYQHPQPVQQALQELRDHAGTQFDPEVVGAMHDVIVTTWQHGLPDWMELTA
jgi:HD-GYP domain-containing protein (c-di-GMP phosphodiesterase class II)